MNSKTLSALRSIFAHVVLIILSFMCLFFFYILFVYLVYIVYNNNINIRLFTSYTHIAN